MAGVLTEMGFIRRFEDKTVRYSSGAEVNARLLAGKAKRVPLWRAYPRAITP